MISPVIIGILALAAALFVIKMIYVISTTVALPITQGALFVSSTRHRISAFLDAVSMKKGDVLIDLGCGDGRVLKMAAKRYGVCAIGYELNPMAYMKARVYSIFSKNVQIRFANFHNADISTADVVFCYLFPDVLPKLSQKLVNELKPGAIFVTCNFPLKGIEANTIIKPEGSLHSDPIYIYTQLAIE